MIFENTKLRQLLTDSNPFDGEQQTEINTTLSPLNPIENNTGNRKLSIADAENQSINAFYTLPQDHQFAASVLDDISHQFTSTPELQDTAIGEVDCRANSCLVQLSRQAAKYRMTLEYQFYLTDALANASLVEGNTLTPTGDSWNDDYWILAEFGSR